MENIPNFRHLIECADNVISVSGLVLNFSLLYFIIYKTGSKLKQYRPILLQNCLIDTFLNIINTITKNQIDQKNGNFYMMMIGPLINVPAPWNNFLICLWVFSVIFCMTSVPVQFVYRYFLIVRNSKPTTCQYIWFLLAAVFAALAYASWTVFTFWPDPVVWEEKARLLRVDKLYREGIPNFVVATVDDWPLKTLFVYAYTLVGISYAFTLFFNYKVYRHLKSLENQMSSQTKEANKQMSTILIVQAAVPGVICLFPIFLEVTFAFQHTNIPGIGAVIGLFFNIIPLANSFFTFVFVKNYRNVIVHNLKQFISLSWFYTPSSSSVHPSKSTSSSKHQIVEQLPEIH